MSKFCFLFLVFRPTRNTTIAARDRLTIYFHAILSKDFKFDPSEDRIFIRAGSCIGNWDEDTVELSVSRYLLLFKCQLCLQWFITLKIYHTIRICYTTFNTKRKKYHQILVYHAVPSGNHLLCNSLTRIPNPLPLR